MSSKTEKLSTKREVDWFCVIFNLEVVVSSFCGLHFIIYEAYLLTTIFSFLLTLLAILGVTAGSHRLWAHHSYKASTSLRIFLMLCQTLTGHTSIYNWVRLHRLHHKYFRTELDPYNTQKGFIYSHFICNNLKLSLAQEKSLEELDMSDIESDKIVMFQKRYYWLLFVILNLLLPINAPVEYWGETILNSIFIVGWLRFKIVYDLSTLIYSATTIFDFNSDEKNAYESNLVFLINKSYWLSYHYLSPWDYQTSEYGKYGVDCTSKFIRVCAALEFASDLRTVDSQVVRDALTMSIDKNKPVSECLSIVQNNHNSFPKQHYLSPAKFY